MSFSELQEKNENLPNSYRMMPLLRLNDHVDSGQMRQGGPEGRRETGRSCRDGLNRSRMPSSYAKASEDK